ncbi:winged helix-turn-helix domain-containing protein [Streptomyces sp. NPDC048641]|uniref:winged helix-turn-helix domain-containing protein n=1 Tax=Streptomyces sp. NPDC048641 TaxID=3154825 RepID=UPI0034206984
MLEAVLEEVLDAGPTAAGWSDQRWTLARIAEVVRRRFGVEYTLAGMDLLLHRIGWRAPVPSRKATERDEAKIAAWKDEQTAADLGAWLCFEDEAGQGLRPHLGPTRPPIVRVTAAGTKRVSMATLICTKPGHRPRLIRRIHLDRGPAKGRRKGFTETDYARLLDAAHQQLGGSIVLVRDNLNTHVSHRMRQLADA